MARAHRGRSSSHRDCCVSPWGGSCIRRGGSSSVWRSVERFARVVVVRSGWLRLRARKLDEDAGLLGELGGSLAQRAGTPVARLSSIDHRLGRLRKGARRTEVRRGDAPPRIGRERRRRRAGCTTRVTARRTRFRWSTSTTRHHAAAPARRRRSVADLGVSPSAQRRRPEAAACSVTISAFRSRSNRVEALYERQARGVDDRLDGRRAVHEREQGRAGARELHALVVGPLEGAPRHGLQVVELQGQPVLQQVCPPLLDPSSDVVGRLEVHEGAGEEEGGLAVLRA